MSFDAARSRLVTFLTLRDRSDDEEIIEDDPGWVINLEARLYGAQVMPNIVENLQPVGPDIQEQDVRVGEGENGVVQHLECPVCFHLMVPPVVNCVNGHSVCGYCRPQLEQCPTCRGNITEIRNRSVEDILGMATARCENHVRGCTVRLGIQALAEHHRTCEFPGADRNNNEPIGPAQNAEDQ